MKASLAMLLKKNVEKMSVFRLATMLMKQNELKHHRHDVDEKKGEKALNAKSRRMDAGRGSRRRTPSRKRPLDCPAAPDHLKCKIAVANEPMGLYTALVHWLKQKS
ncbi:MAG: hypothetical protein ABSF45_11200 [Terriglobia bacterium]|jgi:hypothetical protein